MVKIKIEAMKKKIIEILDKHVEGNEWMYSDAADELLALFSVSGSFSQEDLDKEYDKAYDIGYRDGQKE